MNQELIDEIVTNVLAKIQPIGARHDNRAAGAAQTDASKPSSAIHTEAEQRPTAAKTWIELTDSIITGKTLERTIRPGQAVHIGRRSILTPSARDWLRNNHVNWSRQDKAAGSAGNGSQAKWRVVLQTVTPTVQTLLDALRRLVDGWKVELVGQPFEAASLATNLISTAECDGVIIFTEHADAVACKANRHERVRAAVMQNSKQWEQVTQTIGVNVVCISPIGRSFIELRNLLQTCAASRPQVPAGW